MHRVLLLGSGKIGRMIATLLTGTGDYQVKVGDVDTESLVRLARKIDIEQQVVDATDLASLKQAMQGCDTVISALCYRFNPTVAQAALEAGVSYFDLTEDVETTQRVKTIAEKSASGQIFMPQCGLAPGFISIAAHHLTQSFDTLDTVRLRVGALPQFPSNGLNYNLTWSTDGLINEYCNPCESIYDGRRFDVLPLEGLEHFSLDGICYEAFNTSGGLGTLCKTLDGKVRDLNYKTVRYLGHQQLMAFLVSDLRLGERREVLKDILEKAVPITFQDVVVTFSTVTGHREGELVQVSDARKIYQQQIGGKTWSAIQVTTAAGICAVLDLHATGKLPEQGFVCQEEVSLDVFLANRFGQYYQSDDTARLSRVSARTTVTPVSSVL